MNPAEVCVIYNPQAGRGQAAARLGRLRRFLGGRGCFRPSEGPGHGEELARAAALEGFPLVAAAGGDGTVHEVACGLLASGCPDVTLAVIPVGSANDYAHSLGLQADWWARPDPEIGPRRVDVGRACAGPRCGYFVNGLGVGFNGAVTLESRKVHGLQGLALYGLAVLRALARHFTCTRMSLALDEDGPLVGPTLAFSLALGRREGSFVVAPEALLDDGLFDYVHAGPLRRRDLLRFLPGLATGRPPVHPLVRRGRCRHVRIEAEGPLLIHLDGELFALAGDDVRSLEVTLLPARLRVLGRRPAGVPAC